MPNVYREKQCPRCGVLHRKRRQYCSRECGNVREFSPEQREEINERIVQSNLEYQRTPEALAKNRLLSQARVNGTDLAKAEDFAIDIPDIPDRFSAPMDLGNYDDATDW